VATEAIYGKHRQGKQNARPKIRNPKDVR